MTLKNILLSALSALSIFAFSTTSHAVAKQPNTSESAYEVNDSCEYINPNYCGNNSLTNGLDSNQTTLFYMYSNKEGHFLLDPLAEVENVIFVGYKDFPKTEKKLHHGKRFVGTFEDESLWKLTDLQEVFFE